MSPLAGNVLIILSSPHSDFSFSCPQLKFTALGISVEAGCEMICTQTLKSNSDLEFIFRHSLSDCVDKAITGFL